MNSREPTSRFGEPEAVYRPSPGQTFAGTFVAALGAAVGFAVAGFGCGFDLTNRVCGGLLGVAALWLGWWLYRQQKWRLTLYSGGLVQVRPGGVDELPWTEVREVIQTRMKWTGEPTVRVTVVGTIRHIVVNPVNYRSRERLFETLLAAAQRRGIPVRVEWEESD